MQYANNVSAVDLEERIPAHVDIPRLRQGKVGGFFWYASWNLYLGDYTQSSLIQVSFCSLPFFGGLRTRLFGIKLARQV
jgi:hypothetical protein